MNDEESTSPKRLVLCFDGTGNKFLGNDSDTNIVKIYQLLHRDCPNQYHYYQPGIGTYAQNKTSNSSTPRGLLSRLKASLELSIDQAIGTSFVHHVLAGYQFLMRYYSTGDHIYIFGFSRGAYTARFLAEMVQDIGLLSKGNEEMVHFAWSTFSEYQTTRSDTMKREEKEAYMNKFKQTFCRPHVKVYFLGLFDCVNSVGDFEIPLLRKSSPNVPTRAAEHTRHAVSIHERRLKFKPALFELDCSGKPKDPGLKEVWFAGNHADIGGGWDPQTEKRLLSDIPLEWMIEEIKQLPKGPLEEPSHLAIGEYEKSSHQCIAPHDMLACTTWTSFPGVLAWWVMEILPIFTRLELEDGQWVPRFWPPNFGVTRDIPKDAEIDPSVKKLFEDNVLTQMPKLGGETRKSQSTPNWYAVSSLLVLGVVGAGLGMLRGGHFLKMGL